MNKIVDLNRNMVYNVCEIFLKEVLPMYNDLMDTIGFVGKYDKDVADGMKDELLRQQRNIEIIASENIVSPSVLDEM